MNSNENAMEYANTLDIFNIGHSTFTSFTTLFAFVGGRHVISDLYDHRQDLLCNPIIKIIILFSIIYMNMKSIKTTIFIFFIYIFFIDNYIEQSCKPEYLTTI